MVEVKASVGMRQDSFSYEAGADTTLKTIVLRQSNFVI